MKLIALIICLITLYCGLSASSEFECKYDVTRFEVTGDVYACYIMSNILTKESAKITTIQGTHQSTKSHDDVQGLTAVGNTMHYFPTGLDKYFQNIKAIFVLSCQLKEIHQSDLKQFPNLVSLGFYFNSIEVIDAGLFDFNPNLELIAFLEEKIVHIDSNVFDHLSLLESFYFHLVPCVNQYIENSRVEVEKAIQIVKDRC